MLQNAAALLVEPPQPVTAHATKTINAKAVMRVAFSGQGGPAAKTRAQLVRLRSDMFCDTAMLCVNQPRFCRRLSVPPMFAKLPPLCQLLTDHTRSPQERARVPIAKVVRFVAEL